MKWHLIFSERERDLMPLSEKHRLEKSKKDEKKKRKKKQKVAYTQYLKKDLADATICN